MEGRTANSMKIIAVRVLGGVAAVAMIFGVGAFLRIDSLKLALLAAALVLVKLMLRYRHDDTD